MRRAVSILPLLAGEDEDLNPWQSLSSYRSAAKRRRPFRTPKRVKA